MQLNGITLSMLDCHPIQVRGTAVHTNIIYFYFAFPCLTADKIRVDESSYTGTSMRMHETED